MCHYFNMYSFIGGEFMIKSLIKFITVWGILFLGYACSDSNQIRSRLTPEERTDRLKERLNLTEVQAKEIKQIYIEQDKKINQIRTDFSNDRSAMRDTLFTIRNETDRLIEEILNEEQLEEYEIYKEELRERMRQRFQRNQE
jgi:hypothetical protein